MAIEVGYGPGQMPYTAVMPQSGNRYVYDKEGRRYQVPTDFQGGKFQGQEFTFRENLPDLSRPVDMGGDKGIKPIRADGTSTLVDSSGNPIVGSPANFNYTYDQAMMRMQQQDIKTPAEQAAIQAAIQAGKPTPTLTDPSQFAQAQVGAAVRQPTLPQGGAVLPNLALQTVVPNQLQTTPGLQGTVAAATPAATPAPMIQGATVPSATQVSQAPVPAANTYDYTATTTAGQLPQATAAQGTVTQPMVAAQEDLTSLPPEATVQGQLANISQSITDAVNEGTALPAFAQGAKRLVDSAMQQRGLGASSIAAEALAQGIISASIPIAQQDAALYKDAIFANLNNRQQAALTNANAYLQMDMANLNNNQQTSLANLQIRQQSLFSDQAAQNAASQFNSQSQAQTDQFFSNLNTSVRTANAQRTDAMNQYAIAETNKISAQNAQNQIAVDEADAQREAAINQFNSQLEDQRQRFNVENQRVIDQSNVTWRRQLNTANTAAINAANQTDAQNLLQISNFALSSLWQQWRDEASWVNTASENNKDRAHNIAMAALERETTMALYDEESKAALNGLIGRLGLAIFESNLPTSGTTT